METKLARPKTKTDNKAEIGKVIDYFMSALCRKDVKAMISVYAADAILFDVKPPFQTRGAVAWRHTWEACLPFFPESFQVEVRDLTIHVSGDVGFAHYIFRLTGTAKDDPAAQTWIRCTTGFKKIQGRWKIVHEHGSLPFNPHTREAVFTQEP
ncbi:YybH family protein [Chryseolinea lacunae]|uniref:Nuclear transport factor 2 family protein n=1 Tax=Chryseolinea lacunae TaxID=2801331 RepID=A0ABS1KKP2_9BACT|nr:nuclear transport factor 2 family protein [Chryseolinea lacunae]MBL0740020.1 nuclear transport factor 2 family protein [Chryseolinea lacunae]